jgi:hypothetical protein
MLRCHPFQKFGALGIYLTKQFVARPRAVGRYARTIYPLVCIKAVAQGSVFAYEGSIHIVEKGLCGNGTEGKLPEIPYQKFVEAIATCRTFYHSQKMTPFLIGYIVQPVIRVSAFKTELKPCIAVIDAEGPDCILQIFIPYTPQHIGIIHTHHLLHDATLKVIGEALIEPEVVPGGIGYEVTTPAMSQLMGYEAHQRPVAGDDGGGEEGKPWVLHASYGEAGWQHQHIVPAPAIGTV